MFFYFKLSENQTNDILSQQLGHMKHKYIKGNQSRYKAQATRGITATDMHKTHE